MKILCSVDIFLGVFCIVVIYVAILCSGYDAHLMLSAVKPRHGKIVVIPNNMERYTYFTMNYVTFIDSYQFMLSSLDKFRETRKYLESFYVQQPSQPQTNNVTEGGKEVEVMHIYDDYQNLPYPPPTLMSYQQQQTEEDLELMIQKGVYPYEYMDSFERFQEPQLPPKDAFYDDDDDEVFLWYG